MCAECYHDPCDARCPNAKGPVVVHSCISCGADIEEGEDYYDLDGEPWCESCVNGSRKVAEKEE